MPTAKLRRTITFFFGRDKKKYDKVGPNSPDLKIDQKMPHQGHQQSNH